MTNKSFHINPNLFFQIEDGKTLIWDFLNHNQYIVNAEYLERLIEISKKEKCTNNRLPIDKELEEEGLIEKTTEYSDAWGWDILSKIFHVGTKNIPITSLSKPSPDQWADEYIEYCEEIAKEQPNILTRKKGVVVSLPSANLDVFSNVNFETVIKNRKTCRKFHGTPVSLELVSNLLFSTFGTIHGSWQDLSENDLATTGMRKASPSGGGLHPEEAYLVALRVEGLDPGLYHYRCDEHSLTLIQRGEFEEELIELLWDQYYAKGMGFGIFITARFDKAWWKYKHSRAYRNVLLDVGHVSQTFLLSATALGLKTWLTGAFHDQAVEKFLQIDGVTEGALFFVGGGQGDAETIDDVMKRRLVAHHQKE